MKIDRDVFDQFFNSPYGYRAQYAECPKRGEEANRHVIERMKTSFFDYCSQGIWEATNLEKIMTFLAKPSAKIWWDETRIRPHDLESCQFHNLDFAKLEHVGGLGNIGKKMPLDDIIVVKGAFLDVKFQTEWVPPGKQDRTKDLYRYLFS